MSEERGLIHRGTAVLSASAVESPCRALLSESVGVGQWLMNFSPDDPDAEDLLYASEGPATRQWHQHTEHPFPLRYWVVKKIELANQESGEVEPMLRVVLISPDGDTLSFVSVGVVGSLDLLRTLRGDGPYDPPVGIVVTSEKTRGGFNLLRIRPAANPKPATSPS